MIDIENAIKRLGPNEIRAIGTHENRDKTIDDIEREFRYLEPFRKSIIRQIGNGQPAATTDVQEFLEFASEARRKSCYKRNGKQYDLARKTIAGELSDAELRDAFLDVHKTSADIWKDDVVQELARKAERTYALGKYVQLLTQHQTQGNHRSPSAKEAAVFEEAWEEAIAVSLKLLKPRSLSLKRTHPVRLKRTHPARPKRTHPVRRVFSYLLTSSLGNRHDVTIHSREGQPPDRLAGMVFPLSAGDCVASRHPPARGLSQEFFPFSPTGLASRVLDTRFASFFQIS